jgi:hypothetical protein
MDEHLWANESLQVLLKLGEDGTRDAAPAFWGRSDGLDFGEVSESHRFKLWS